MLLIAENKRLSREGYLGYVSDQAFAHNQILAQLRQFAKSQLRKGMDLSDWD